MDAPLVQHSLLDEARRLFVLRRRGLSFELDQLPQRVFRLVQQPYQVLDSCWCLVVEAA